MLFTKLYKKIKKRKIIFVFGVLIIFTIGTILQNDISPDLYFIHWGALENISCHYMDAGDGLPVADENFSPPPRSIFFHETSCQGVLNARQSCAVESAARTHPDWHINVLFAAPVSRTSLNRSSLGLLRQFANVKLLRILISTYAKRTPLESMVAGGALNRTRWRVSHTSDVLRYLTLYKWGGVYLDLDVVVARPLGSLARNWAARESDTVVASGMLAFSRDQVGRKVAEEAINDIKSKYRGDIWGHNGPGVITRVLQKLCSTRNAKIMSAATCNGFEVYGPQFFYPIEWQRSQTYFKSGGTLVPNAYVYHVWNHRTQRYKITKNCPYARLAKKYCPTTYKTFASEFGL